MSNQKYSNDDSSSGNDEEQSSSSINLLGNHGTELFDDGMSVVHRLINIKRVSLPKNGENWDFLENNIVVFTLKGIRLTKKEKQFLYTADGINLLINEYKGGDVSVNKIKQKIKEKIK